MCPQETGKIGRYVKHKKYEAGRLDVEEERSDLSVRAWNAK